MKPPLSARDDLAALDDLTTRAGAALAWHARHTMQVAPTLRDRPDRPPT